MAIRAKMTLNSIVETHFGPISGPWAPSKQARFSACYDTSIPEDARFQKATPNANADFTIDNPAAIDQLIPGKSYYFDISPVPDAPAKS